MRYRGYYYDEETGFYYLNARYYDPEVRRFISADNIDVVRVAPMGLTDKNLYAYCDNNPINRIDATGQLWDSIFEFTKTVDAEIDRTIGGLAPAYAGCSGLAIAEGPLPIGDAVAVVGIMLLTVGSIGYGIYQAVEYSSLPKTKSKAKEETVAIT